MIPSRAAAVLLGLLLASACADEGTRAVAPGADVDLLETLGYVESAEAPADPARTGAHTFDAALVSPGYNLYTRRRECEAVLQDLDGRVVHTWSQPGCRNWNHSELLADGDLLAQEGRTVARIGWRGEIRWKARIHNHHDVERTSSGDVLTLGERRLTVDSKDLDLPRIKDNMIVRFAPDGKLTGSISLYDVFRRNAIGFELSAPRYERAVSGDIFHANSIESMRRPELAARSPLYALDNALLSLRSQHAIAIVDLVRRELVWAWGPGEIEGQHDATVLDDGNILLFDNGVFRKWSRVLEVDPQRREIVWSYGDAGPNRFYSLARGAAQRLPNGNTLVSISNEGIVREVTRGGRTVWEWGEPRMDRGGRHRRTIYRMVRYPPEHVEPLLAAGAPRPE